LIDPAEFSAGSVASPLEFSTCRCWFAVSNIKVVPMLDSFPAPDDSAETVDAHPLAAPSASFRTAKIVKRPGCLILGPSAGLRLFALLFVMVSVVGTGIGVTIAALATWERELWLILCCVGLFDFVFASVGLVLLFAPRRFEFDRNFGQWTTRSFFSRGSRPLSSIRGVQLICGGWHTATSSNTSPSSGRYRTYQLNLILDDPRRPRINLTNHGDVPWTLEAAGQIADFLGVPLHNHLENFGRGSAAAAAVHA
jgi:hypothetical protein